jgi:hypothetical protein
LTTLRSADLDDEVAAFLAERACRTAAEFGQKPRELPSLEWGEGAEYRTNPGDGRPTIFVARAGADWWRIRYQIAHEVFHWLCTPPGTFHWTHELFAVELAVRAMDELGQLDYAARTVDSLTAQAELLPLQDMLGTPLAPPYPPGLYGRAWVTGRLLDEAVGWERLKPLASSFDLAAQPDVVGWVRSLPRGDREKAGAVLGTVPEVFYNRRIST